MSKSPKNPPRFVPTLTQVVPDTSPAPLPKAPPPSATHPPPLPAAQAEATLQVSDGFEEILVHRLMQRVDVGLDQRLHEAIAIVIKEQTRSMLPRLREEVESVVRQVVYVAVADELSNKKSF